MLLVRDSAHVAYYTEEVMITPGLYSTTVD